MPEATPFFPHPHSQISLGLGFDPLRTGEPKRPYANFDPAPHEPPADPGTQFHMYSAQTAEEYRRALGIDATLDATYLSYDFDARYSQRDNYSTESNSLTLVMEGKTETERRRVTFRDLLGHARDLLAEPGHEQEFFNRYGSRVVVAQDMATKFLVRLTMQNQRRMRELFANAEIGFNADALFGDAHLRSSYEEALNSAAASGALDIDVVSHSTNIRNLLPLVRLAAGQPGVIERIRQILQEHLDASDKTWPIRFWHSPISDFGGPPRDGESLLGTDKARRLLELADQYRYVRTQRDIVKQIVRGQDPRRHLVKAERLDSLRALHSEWGQYLTVVSNAHQECLYSNGAGVVPDLEHDPAVEVPSPPPINMWRQVVTGGTAQDREFSDAFFRGTLDSQGWDYRRIEGLGGPTYNYVIEDNIVERARYVFNGQPIAPPMAFASDRLGTVVVSNWDRDVNRLRPAGAQGTMQLQIEDAFGRVVLRSLMIMQ
jgi:hypothetical protein